MSIYFFGAFFDHDVSDEFISKGLACVGYSKADAPPLHNILKHIRPGDIAVLKAYPPRGPLSIKAVGIVTGDKVRENVRNLGSGVEVRWVWHKKAVVVPQKLLDDKFDQHRRGTLHEEQNVEIARIVIDLLCPKKKKKKH